LSARCYTIKLLRIVFHERSSPRRAITG